MSAVLRYVDVIGDSILNSHYSLKETAQIDTIRRKLVIEGEKKKKGCIQPNAHLRRR